MIVDYRVSNYCSQITLLCKSKGTEVWAVSSVLWFHCRLEFPQIYFQDWWAYGQQHKGKKPKVLSALSQPATLTLVLLRTIYFYVFFKFVVKDYLHHLIHCSGFCLPKHVKELISRVIYADQVDPALLTYELILWMIASVVSLLPSIQYGPW